MNNIKIFTGNSNPNLAKKIAKNLNINISNADINKFNDGEINVKINENVRGNDIYIIQSICSPCNDNFMELIIMIDAIYRASAKRITAVIPYFGYGRQDRRIRNERVPISAKVIANILSNSGINRILTVDLHSEQTQGFFNIPIDNIYSDVLFKKDILKKKISNPLIVSPDTGSIVRARTIANSFKNKKIAFIDKYRKRANFSQVMNIVGDVKNHNCILIDDIIDTGITLHNAAEILKKNGSKKIFVYATHPIFSGDSYKYIKKSNIDKIIVCDTIPLKDNIKNLVKIQTLSLSETIAEVINRLNKEKSISIMFNKN